VVNKFVDDETKMPPTFQDRLSIILKELHLQDQELAQAGGVSKATFNSYKNGAARPRFHVLESWCQQLHINGDWLLTGKGDMLLADHQVPLTSPLALRVNQVELMMTECGADMLDILRAARAMIDGEISRLTKERGGVGDAETQAGLTRAAETPSDYAAQKKAVGD
jgi:transcriptional regulator with XRE-family HTH domain